MIVTIRHMFTIPYFNARRGFCRPMAREWARRHGLDFEDFVRNGIEAEKLVATGDGFALALVKWACECEAKGRSNGR